MFYQKEIGVNQFMDELDNANCRFVCGPYFVYFDADNKFAYTNINNPWSWGKDPRPPDPNEITHIDYKGNIIFRMEKGNELPKGLSIYDREGNMILTMTCTGMMSWITKNDGRPKDRDLI